MAIPTDSLCLKCGSKMDLNQKTGRWECPNCDYVELVW